MIQAGKPPRVPQLILLIGTGTLLVLSLYMALYLYPAYRDLGYVQDKVYGEAADLERMKTLFPVKARAKNLEKIKFRGRLPFPERVKLPRIKLAILPERLSAAADSFGMILSSSDFDINGMDEASQKLSLTLELSGKLTDFRRFLINTIAHPSVDSISTMTISSGKGETKLITLTLNIWIEKAGS